MGQFTGGALGVTRREEVGDSDGKHLNDPGGLSNFGICCKDFMLFSHDPDYFNWYDTCCEEEKSNLVGDGDELISEGEEASSPMFVELLEVAGPSDQEWVMPLDIGD